MAEVRSCLGMLRLLLLLFPCLACIARNPSDVKSKVPAFETKYIVSGSSRILDILPDGWEDWYERKEASQ